jgi:hypothetical protein
MLTTYGMVLHNASLLMSGRGSAVARGARSPALVLTTSQPLHSDSIHQQPCCSGSWLPAECRLPGFVSHTIAHS